MSLRDTKTAYESMSEEIFNKERYHRWFRGAIPYVTASWDPTGLENSINEIVLDSIARRTPGINRSIIERTNDVPSQHLHLFTHMPSPLDLCRV